MIRLGTVGPCTDASRRGTVPLACARRWVGVARPGLPPFVFRAGGGGRPRQDACGIAPKAPGRWMSAHAGVGVATGPWVGLPEPREPRLFPGALDATQPPGGNGCEDERVSCRDQPWRRPWPAHGVPSGRARMPSPRQPPVRPPWGLRGGKAHPGRTAPAKGGDHHPWPPAAERTPKHEKGDPKAPFPSSSPS